VREGGGTVRSIAGLRSGQVSEIMFVDKERSEQGGGSLGRAAPLINVFGQEEEEGRDEFIGEPSSIFNRPGFGSVAFRNSISAFNAMSIHNQEDGDKKEDSIGSAGSLAGHSSHGRPEVWPEDGELSDSEDEDSGEYTSLTMFLAAIGLHDWARKFIRERIDLEALMLLSETDLKEELGMPTGHRKKLLKAVEERRRDMESPEEIIDSRL